MSEQLKYLQKAVGTEVDGVFGPKTLKAAASFYNLTPCQAAHFFGQIDVETCGFKVFEENLNYSFQGLLTTFPSYFGWNDAQKYAGQPIQIANHVYANRLGNGPESSYDGWKYRGRGAIQITGKCNYESFADFLGNTEPITNPDCLVSSYAFLSAFWFFGKNKIWDVAKHGISEGDIKAVTRKVNGGCNCLESRIEKTKKYYNYF